MAVGSIRGITIEIEGKTSGLVKSLGNVNKSLAETQKALKTVDQALKLDPKNIDALKTKQNLLKDAIADTEEKLKLEKQAAADAAKALEEGTITKSQYDTLQAEVAKTSGELTKLKGEAEKTNKSLKELGGSSKLSNFTSALDGVSAKLKAIGDKCVAVGKQMSMKITAPLVGLGAAAVNTAAEFESSMAKVQAVSGASGEDLEKLEAKAREMGANTKFSASEAAEAMNYMAMAGWKTEDMLGGISGIMNLAAASGEDLATTSDIVTDALTAFGMSADESGRLADVLAAASSNANTNVSMMGESFKYVAPLAGSMGYSAEDVAVALGLMANSGVKASSAGTALRTLLTNMAKPTDQMESAMEALGISLDDGAGNMKSLRQIMSDLRNGFGTLKISTSEMEAQMKLLDGQLESGAITEEEYQKATEDLAASAFGAEGAMKAEAAAALAGKQGLSGLMAIVNASDEDFDKLTAAIDNSNGSAQGMADIMSDTLEGRVAEMKSRIQELGIQIGEKLIPIVEKVVEWISNVVDWFSNLDEGTQDVILTIAGVVAAIGPLLVIGGKLATGISSIIGLVSTVTTAVAGAGGLSAVLTGLAGAAGPIAATVAAIGAVIAVIKNWDEIMDVLSFAWDKCCEGIKWAIDGVSSVWNGLVDSIESGIEKILGDVNAARDATLEAQQLALETSGINAKIAQNKANYEKYGTADTNKIAAMESAASMAARNGGKTNLTVNTYIGSGKAATTINTTTTSSNMRSGGH